MGRPIGLSTFTVGPTPAGSLDATLAAARISAFALDWRRPMLAGRGGGVGPPREVFDVTLFIDTTTAARPNPRQTKHKAGSLSPNYSSGECRCGF